jgi:hypothetical protein
MRRAATANTTPRFQQTEDMNFGPQAARSQTVAMASPPPRIGSLGDSKLKHFALAAGVAVVVSSSLVVAAPRHAKPTAHARPLDAVRQAVRDDLRGDGNTPGS